MQDYAVIFPGQGSQSVGMLSGFMQHPAVSATFDEAGEVLGYDLRAVCLNGPEEELGRTEVTQPAILTASVAAFRALSDGLPPPQAASGHSLGEYSALVAAGSLELPDALRLVRLRGQAMQEAVPRGSGAMAAVLGLEEPDIAACCAEASTADEAVWVANLNAPGQVVISGAAAAVERAAAAVQERGARRVVTLPVSAPSHCPLMSPAAARLREALAQITLRDARFPVYVNVTAAAVQDHAELSELLVRQLTEPVRWVDCVRQLSGRGLRLLIEAGPGRVLSGLCRRIDRSLTLCSVDGEDGLRQAQAAVAG